MVNGLGKGNRYDAELKAQVIKEVKETKNIALVARTRGLIYNTVSGWILAERKAPAKKQQKDQKELRTRLAKLELENRILKELLKKTNQAWLSDELLQNSSLPREI